MKKNIKFYSRTIIVTILVMCYLITFSPKVVLASPILDNVFQDTQNTLVDDYTEKIYAKMDQGLTLEIKEDDIKKMVKAYFDDESRAFEGGLDKLLGLTPQDFNTVFRKGFTQKKGFAYDSSATNSDTSSERLMWAYDFYKYAQQQNIDINTWHGQIGTMDEQDPRSSIDIINEADGNNVGNRNTGTTREQTKDLVDPIIIIGTDQNHVTEPTLQNELKGINKIILRIWSSLSLILQVLSISIIIITGIRYMLAAPSGKADIKKQTIYLIIGASFVFATIPIIQFIVKIANDIL